MAKKSAKAAKRKVKLADLVAGSKSRKVKGGFDLRRRDVGFGGASAAVGYGVG